MTPGKEIFSKKKSALTQNGRPFPLPHTLSLHTYETHHGKRIRSPGILGWSRYVSINTFCVKRCLSVHRHIVHHGLAHRRRLRCHWLHGRRGPRGGAKYSRNAEQDLILLSQDFDAAREKALKCGAKGFILEVCTHHGRAVQSAFAIRFARALHVYYPAEKERGAIERRTHTLSR